MEKKITFSRPEMNDFNEMGEVYNKVLKKDAQGLTAIYQKNPDAMFKKIMANGDTIFHIAAYKGVVGVLQALVKMVPSSKKRELLEVKNIRGNTILHEVAASRNVKAAEILIGELLYAEGPRDIHERKEILGNRNKFGETPLFRAAGWGNKDMVKYFAREIERVGYLHDHFKRDDQISILHVAVMGQNFESTTTEAKVAKVGEILTEAIPDLHIQKDSAIWVLEKDPQLATSKDNDGNTCLHLLASMPAAFRSTSPFRSSSLAVRIFSEAIYHCLPSNSPDEDETSNPQNEDLEQGESSKAADQSKRSKDSSMTIDLGFPGFRLYFSFCRFLTKGLNCKMIDRIWRTKHRHESAVKLAKILVGTDASWFKAHEEESDTICLKRTGEKGVLENSASRGMEPHEPETPLFIAASTGIVEIVREILTLYPQAVGHINERRQNILHVAGVHRTYEVFDFVKINCDAEKLFRGIDYHGCTILHHAADTKYYREETQATPPLQLQQELRWFQDVKDAIPSHFTMHLNKRNKTADELFNDTHSKQLKTAQEWVKNTCESCSTVAVLVAGVVFAAAFQPPGGFENGRSVLQEKPLYSLFAVMDVAALASSLTSVVIFLSVLTSSREFKDFHRRIPLNLSFGFIFLFFSVISTMLTFTATMLLLVEMKLKTQSLTYAAALFPICVFAVFQFPLYNSYILCTFKIIGDYLERNLPGNWRARIKYY